MIIRVDGKNTSSGAYNILLEKLILDGSALEGVAFELSEEVIGTGERTAASNVTGILSSGSAADLSTAAITHKQQPDAATVDKDTGIISRFRRHRNYRKCYARRRKANRFENPSG